MTGSRASTLSGSKLLACLLLPVFLVLSSSLFAAKLTVRIFERGGKAPIEGVAVCLGTPASLSQFGAGLTDAEGYVIFASVPQASLLATASMPGFMSRQEHLNAAAEDRLLVLSLPRGGGGVDCPMGGEQVAAQTEGLSVRSFQLNRGAAVTSNRLVTLDHLIAGRANQYRASERPDFAGVGWRPYEDSPRFMLGAGQGDKTVYFQVRRHAVINGADIEARSGVLRDTIHLQY